MKATKPTAFNQVDESGDVPVDRRSYTGSYKVVNNIPLFAYRALWMFPLCYVSSSFFCVMLIGRVRYMHASMHMILGLLWPRQCEESMMLCGIIACDIRLSSQQHCTNYMKYH